ncbi:MAG: DUF1702 family protein [Pirellulales bacterium]|nr:DUF1702 family protein [Pirellulales bacterium]
MSLGRRLRKLLFGISPQEATFARRGFRRADPDVQARLERIGRTFIQGYHAALEVTDPQALSDRLEEVENAWRGFAYEGAAMGLALLDFLIPGRRDRWQRFLEGPGDAHAYMLHVGVGWAAARLPWVRRDLDAHLRRFDPLFRWLVVDGYGFHEGYFHWSRYADGRTVPKRLSGYGQRAFDQGLGRCLWFIHGADPQRIELTIRAFPTGRHADLFSGLGLACTYAGGGDRATLEQLLHIAGIWRPQLAQGAAFAAKARQRADNAARHAETACGVLCGMSADAAAAITDRSLAKLPIDGTEPAFELWRREIQAEVVGERVVTGRPGPVDPSVV